MRRDRSDLVYVHLGHALLQRSARILRSALFSVDAPEGGSKFGCHAGVSFHVPSTLGIVGLNDSLLRASVQRGTPTVRALLLDPECEAARRRATEIGEGFESFASGIRLAISRLRELNEQTGTVCCYLYTMLPTWRVIALDGTMFVSAFGETHEGHTSPMYRLTGSPHGALYRGFRRFVEELLGTAPDRWRSWWRLRPS